MDSTRPAFLPTQPFLVAFDSDGCVFDSMAVKHRGAFGPAFVEVFGLEALSEPALAVWDYVNLGSPTRGANRFKALARALELLPGHPQARALGLPCPRLPRLAEWVARSPGPSIPALEAEARAHPHPELDRALAWSIRVNERVGALAGPLPPFPGVRAAIEALEGRADRLVLSQTPLSTLRAEWEAAGLAGKMRVLLGQDSGSKASCLSALAPLYGGRQALMIGDAPGDREAARAAAALFFPILPGREAASWRLFLDEALPRFFAGSFAGEFEALLESDFAAAFPESPPWLESEGAQTAGGVGDHLVA